MSSYFLINNSQISDECTIADRFNRLFVGIGPKLAYDINTADKRPFTNNLLNPVQHTFAFTQISSTDISKILSNFTPKSSVGHDNLSMKLIKGIGYSLALPLALIINQSFNTGIFPDKLKLAKVLPLFKKDDKTILDNYRPISLLPCISEIFKNIVYNQVCEYFFVSKTIL